MKSRSKQIEPLAPGSTCTSRRETAFRRREPARDWTARARSEVNDPGGGEVNGQFDSPITLPTNLTDLVDISGPLVDVDPKATKAKVLFLIVQGDGANAVTVYGEGAWTGGTSWF